jgi:hypothetical protein
MANFVPVERSRHAEKAWQRVTSFSFAATDAVLPLVGSEFGKAALAMPIVFVEQSGRYAPMAMMSPIAGRNLFVGPAGQWLGSYMPAAMRSYPFFLVRVEGSEESAVCVDEDSGLVIDADGTAENFFEADGSLSPATKGVLDFLSEIQRNRQHTELAVAALADAGLIQPWPFQVANESQTTQVNGLFRVNEAALNALDDEAFLKLRKMGALPLAYLQLVSMAQVTVFERLIGLQKQLAPRQERQHSLDEIFAAAANDTIRFN